MLAKNKSGWKLLEYISIPESDICRYENVTGAYAIIVVSDKFLVGYNSWRNQWEFPAGGIDQGETAREAAIRELYEETHQRNNELEFRGLFKVEDSLGTVKYQAVFVGYQSKLFPFERKEDDEFDEINLWDLKEDIGYVDEVDVKIAKMVCAISS
jgi:8-oxo-dGTP diphosphatase